ncbi:MAG TPA: copper resistance CopC family protein [Candidatus Angelobacter sp.]|nr:copper resistance CopC family protein [Candidatus Angelobacter sp.]
MAHFATRYAHRPVKTIPKGKFLHWLLIGTILLLNHGQAWAHAVIVESTPQVNGVVTGPTLEIKLRFNARIDGGRSKLTLIFPDGVSHVVTLSPQTSPDLLAARAPSLTPGKYQLHWQVLAGDGHITQGNIPFSVVSP